MANEIQSRAFSQQGLDLDEPRSPILLHSRDRKSSTLACEEVADVDAQLERDTCACIEPDGSGSFHEASMFRPFLTRRSRPKGPLAF